jgi:hypothetical protein
MTDDDYRSRLEQAYDVDDAPPLVPTDAARQMIISDERPRGAIIVDVPRKEAMVFARIRAVASAAGDDFFYRWPVKKFDKKTNREEIDWVEGPSVKLTNAVARMYGNCGIKTRVIDEGKHWMIYVQFTDFETGYTMERPFQQRKAQNVGKKMDADRATDLVFQIGVSKATRNVVANALSDFVNYAFLEAKDGIAKRITDKPEIYRARIRERLSELKVEVSRVEAHVGRPIEKWLVPDMAKVVAEIQTINDGMADIDDLWPGEPIAVPEERGEREPAHGQLDSQEEGLKSTESSLGHTGPAAKDTGEAVNLAKDASEAPPRETVASKATAEPTQAEDGRDAATRESNGPALTPAEEAQAIIERLDAAITDGAYNGLDELNEAKAVTLEQLGDLGLGPDEVDVYRGQLAALILGARRQVERNANKKKGR